MDITQHSTAAIWGARDPQTDVVYLYDEYCSREGDPVAGAKAIWGRGEWIPGVVDPLGNGRNQIDGYRLIEIYRNEFGLNLQGANNPLDSGILVVGQRMFREG